MVNYMVFLPFHHVYEIDFKYKIIIAIFKLFYHVRLHRLELVCFDYCFCYFASRTLYLFIYLLAASCDFIRYS